MAKIIDYPRANFKLALELAKAVDELGSSCKVETAAEKLGKKIGGAFSDIVSGAGKYNLIISKQGSLQTTDLYRAIKLSYDEKEKNRNLTKSLLSVPLFKEIYTKYKDVELQVAILDKILMREFEVNEGVASRVSTYFIDAAKLVGLLGPDNRFTGVGLNQDAEKQLPEVVESVVEVEPAKPNGSIVPKTSSIFEKPKGLDTYLVAIKGPGMDTNIEIFEEEDLLIVDVMLQKIRKKLLQKVREPLEITQ